MIVICLDNLNTYRPTPVGRRPALEVGQQYLVTRIGRGVRAKMYFIAGLGWFEARRFS